MTAAGRSVAANAGVEEATKKVTLVGTPSHVQERIAALREAGVTHLHVSPVGTDPLKLLAQVKEWIA